MIEDKQKVRDFFNNPNQISLDIGTYFREKLVKMSIDNRFYSLYIVPNYNFITNDLKHCCFYDSKERTLFHISSYGKKDMLDDLLIDSNLDIRTTFLTLEDIRKEILDDINKGIIQYIKINYDSLMMDAFHNERVIKESDMGAKNYAIEYFLQDGTLDKIEEDYDNYIANVNDYSLTRKKFWNDDYLSVYFYDKKNLIDKGVRLFVDSIEQRESILKNLLMRNRDKKYFEEIQSNVNHDYDDLIKRKKILKAINDIDAVNINIIINYNNKDFQFKFDRSSLIDSLQSPFSESTGNWQAKQYKPVEDFLKENKNQEGSIHPSNFEFSNIRMIMYSNKVLYEFTSFEDTNKKYKKQDRLERIN